MRADRTAPHPSSQPKRTRRRRPRTWTEAQEWILESLVANRNQVRCRCGAQATHLHLVPWVGLDMEVVPACRRHDPAGYWIAIDDLVKDWDDWRRHLHTKVEGEQGWRVLMDWLWRVTA